MLPERKTFGRWLHFRACWRLVFKQKVRSTVSVRSTPGAWTNGIAHHIKGCLGDISPGTLILYHKRSDLKGGNTSEKIATDIVNFASTIRSEKTKVFIAGLTVSNDKFRKIRKEGNHLWKKIFGWRIKLHWQPEHILENVESKRTLFKWIWN